MSAHPSYEEESLLRELKFQVIKELYLCILGMISRKHFPVL